MDINVIYHLKKFDELTQNIDVAAFDHAWLFIRYTLEICYNITDIDATDTRGANIKLLDYISDNNIKGLAHDIRKKEIYINMVHLVR